MTGLGTRLARWFMPDDPRYCQLCGSALVRRAETSFDPDTGAAIERPFATCPELRVSWLGPSAGGWRIVGAWPEHTFIGREPIWTEG